jgi:hypothetical protein
MITPSIDDAEHMFARFRFRAPQKLRPCRFVDVWERGAALELYAVDACEPLGGLAYLDRHGTGDALGSPICAVVTHGVRTELGRVIVCIAFTLLSYQQRLEVNELIDRRRRY